MVGSQVSLFQSEKIRSDIHQTVSNTASSAAITQRSAVNSLPGGFRSSAGGPLRRIGRLLLDIAGPELLPVRVDMGSRVVDHFHPASECPRHWLGALRISFAVGCGKSGRKPTWTH